MVTIPFPSPRPGSARAATVTDCGKTGNSGLTTAVFERKSKHFSAFFGFSDSLVRERSAPFGAPHELAKQLSPGADRSPTVAARWDPSLNDRKFLLSIGSIAIALAIALSPSIVRAASSTIDFNRDVQPILSDNCYHCHGPDAAQRKAHLRFDLLDPKQGPFVDHDGQQAIVPGHPEQSLLIARILSEDEDEKMPPARSHRQLSAAQVEVLKAWVQQGAKWGQHWSLVPPVKAEPPAVNDAAWPRNAIDRFILARLEREGLSPSPEAPRATLIRRVTLDLTGLPPTPAEVDAFVADASPDAYEKLVDRLFASPRYGERMVWEWLDAARYADTNGYQGDNTRTMWPWRDWAIRAFNENMPYDQFTIRQLAGDLLPDATPEEKLATGFCRNHMINGEGGRIAEENRVEYVMDQVETTGTVWLGLTVGCCRCHDHKFDPITQKEYYQLFAFFNNTPVTGAGGAGQTAPVVDFSTPQQRATAKELDEAVAAAAAEVTRLENETFTFPKGGTIADAPKLASLSGNIVGTLKQPPEKRYLPSFREIIPKLRDTEPTYIAAVERFFAATDKRTQFSTVVPRVMVMEEMKKPRPTFVLVKGAYDKPADPVTAGTPAVLPPLPADAPHDRLALARWLVSPDHPLTSRVTVNRFWQQFFGYGLVKTVDDFGAQGEKPVHPELLDWLARDFIESEWDVKRLHRLIVTSAAYRQSSKVTPALFERDPENRLLRAAAACACRHSCCAIRPWPSAGSWWRSSAARRSTPTSRRRSGKRRRSGSSSSSRTMASPSIAEASIPSGGESSRRRSSSTRRRARSAPSS